MTYHGCHLICFCQVTLLFFQFLTYLWVSRTLNLVVLGPEICDEKILFLLWRLSHYRGIKYIKFISYCKRITYNPTFCLDAGYMIFIFILVYYLIYLLPHCSYVLTAFTEIFTIIVLFVFSDFCFYFISIAFASDKEELDICFPRFF